MSHSEDYNAEKVLFFEGITACGKSTLISKVQQRLEQSGKSARVDDSSVIYPAISKFRKTELRTAQDLVKDLSFFQMMSWGRFEGKPYVDVACVDRFLLSSLVYTLSERDRLNLSFSADSLRNSVLNPLGTSPLMGGTLVYLDCPVDLAQERVQGRTRKKFDYDLQSRARDHYLKELARADFPAIILDAADSIESNSDRIMSFLGL